MARSTGAETGPAPLGQGLPQGLSLTLLLKVTSSITWCVSGTSPFRVLQTAAKGQLNTQCSAKGWHLQGARDEGYKTHLQLQAFGLPWLVDLAEAQNHPAHPKAPLKGLLRGGPRACSQLVLQPPPALGEEQQRCG